MYELSDMMSPLDYRYYGHDEVFYNRLHPFVSAKATIRYLLKVESNLAKMLGRGGICSEEISREIRKACDEVTFEEVYEEERKTSHSTRALVHCIRDRISDGAKPYVHIFVTSADVIDTATTLQMKDIAFRIILPDLMELETVLIRLAREYADVPQIGRTHGQHAEPITFGFYLANFINRLGGRIKSIKADADELRGQFSGAVGAYNSMSLAFPEDPAAREREFLAELGIRSAEPAISTQIVAPEYMADLMYSIISCYSVLANIGDDLRHLQRSEIDEITEKVSDTHIGSSTMPHKINPKDWENIKSLWKAMMPNMITVFLDQISEHQRDLTNSASNRMNIHVVCMFDYSVRRTIQAFRVLEIRKDSMARNLQMKGDLILAEPLYILLALEGVSDAYGIVKKAVNSHRSTGENFLEILKGNEGISEILDGLSSANRELLSDPARYIGDSINRTHVVCDHWESYLERLEKELR